MLKHALVAFLMVGLPAVAQENMPAGEQPSTTTGEQPPANEALPACPPGEQPPAAAVPAPPPMAQPAPEAMPPPVAHHRKHNIVFAPQEFMLTTGAGPTNYFGSSNTMRTDVGAGWDVRGTFGARSIIALEAAYMGDTNTVEQNSLHNGNINSNGLDTDFRLQLPYRVQPYIFGGVGWNYMTLNNSTISATQRTTDNQVTVPAGVGFSAYPTRHMNFDLRGTYRYIGDNDLQTTGAGSTVSHQWLAQARLGYAF